MSKPNDPTKPVAVITDVPEKPQVVEKQSLVKRGTNFVKSHKKTTIAVAGLVSLVGLSALAGRKTAPSTDVEPTQEPVDDFDQDLEEFLQAEAEANNG